MMSTMNLRILTELTPASAAAVISIVLGIVADILLLFLLLRQQSMHEMEIKLNEVEKASSNQTQMAYMTENAGFNKIDSRASAILILD